MIKSFLYIIIIFFLLMLIILNSILINNHREQYNYIKIESLKTANLYAQDIAEELIRSVDDFSHLQKSVYIRNNKTLLITKKSSFEKNIEIMRNIYKIEKKNEYKCNLNLYRDCDNKLLTYCIPDSGNFTILCDRYENEYSLEARNSNTFKKKQSIILDITESKSFSMNNPRFFSIY